MSKRAKSETPTDTEPDSKKIRSETDDDSLEAEWAAFQELIAETTPATIDKADIELDASSEEEIMDGWDAEEATVQHRLETQLKRREYLETLRSSRQPITGHEPNQESNDVMDEQQSGSSSEEDDLEEDGWIAK